MHDGHRVTRTLLQLVEQLTDLFRFLLTTLRKGSNLIGHHREPPTLLAGPGRLDGRFKARRLVFSEIPVVTLNTAPIFSLFSPSFSITPDT